MALFYLATISVVYVACVFLALESLSKMFYGEYRERALAIVQSFDAQYGSLAEIEDRRTQEHIDRLMALNPNIYKMSVYVPRGDEALRIASSDKSLIGTVAGPFHIEPMFTNRPIYFDKNSEGEPLVEVIAPLHDDDGKTVGAIGVYLRLAPRDEAVRNLAFTFVTVGGFSAILLLVVLFAALDWILLKPLALLKRSVEAIETGTLTERIPIGNRRDELGKLSAAFNKMIDALDRRDKQNKELHMRLQERYDRARAQAITDPVTTLFNHRFFQDQLGQELQRARRFETSVALLFIDIDDFKGLNDGFGHQVGDRVLYEVASAVGEVVRDIDIVARYGGDEFAIVLPGANAKGATVVAERIKRIIAKRTLAATGKALTVSIGVAIYPEDGDSREDLIWRADRAMYYAKQLGRDQVRSYRELSEVDDTEKGKLDWDGLGKADYWDIVRSLAVAADARDKYNRSHSESVARYSVATVKAMGLSSRHLQNIGIAALLHDVGKIGIPDAILSKPGPLTPAEWEKMREHPSIGEAIVSQVLSLEQVVPLIACHQERYDGTGYPRGLKGEEIPIGARIIAVADAYHSMTSDRPYRKAKSHREAIDELVRCAGVQFDPAVVDAFVTAVDGPIDDNLSGAEHIYETIMTKSNSNVGGVGMIVSGYNPVTPTPGSR